ncbi:hypothetical protein HRbin33_00599 [bacterium HR33]|nr:hypothetical protein HRbin33_00599 [bacterium HR33]
MPARRAKSPRTGGSRGPAGAAKAAAKKVRLVFRGLIWYHFEKPRTAKDSGWVSGSSRGTLTAYLINDADCHHADHYHVPRLACIGREATTGAEVLGRPHIIAGQRLVIGGIGSGGVAPDASFHEHVPWMREVYYGSNWASQPAPVERNWNLVAAEVVVPAGRIWTRTLATWTPDIRGSNPGPERPVRYGFFWNPQWTPRSLANECIVEADLEGDALELEALSTQLYSEGVPRKLAPLTDSAVLRHEVEPDTVDLLITNLPAYRARRTPWAVHYAVLFEAAGFPGAPYGPEFSRLEQRARALDRESWERDAHMLELIRRRRSPARPAPWGYPFPHLVGDSGALLPDTPWLHNPTGSACGGGDE